MAKGKQVTVTGTKLTVLAVIIIAGLLVAIPLMPLIVVGILAWVAVK